MAAPPFSLIVPLANLGGPDFPYRVNNVREMLAAFPRDLVEVVLVEQVVAPALPTFAGELGQAPGAVWETARHGQFCKGWLYNLGARRAAGRHLVFAESDCLPENPPAYFDALHGRLEERGDAWLIGWSEIIYLGPDGRSIYRRAQPQKGFSEGGLLVAERGAFTAIGGANEFFLGLGGMDNEIVRRLETQGPHQTFPWRMVHRYHPESALKTSMGLRLRNAGLYEYIRFNPAQSCRALAGLMRERQDWSRPLAASHTWAGLVADDLAAKAQEAARRHQAGELDQAEFFYRQIIAAQPGDPAANYNLALIGIQAGCPLDSLAHLGRAAQASPGAAGVAYAQGLALEQARRLAPAGEAYARALRLDPGLSQAQARVVAVQEQQRQEAASAGPVRVGLLTALWQRPELTRFVLGYYGGLKLPGVELVLLAVGSEGQASRRLAQEAGWAYVEAPNSPLSRKWQAGLHALQGMNPDYVCLVGSDDLISPGYLPQAVKLCPPGGAVGLHDIMFLDLASGRMGRYSETTRNPAPGHQGDEELYVSFGGGYLRTLGAGRVYSRAMLDSLNWVLWPQDKDRSLDAMAEHHILAQGLHPGVVYGMGQLDCLLVDVKSGHNLWGFEKYRYCQVFTPEQTRAALARQGMAGVLDLGQTQAAAVAPDRPVAAPAPPFPSPAPAAKVGRNDPCPCGSGKKYKRCCLAAQRATGTGAGAEAAAGLAAG